MNIQPHFSRSGAESIFRKKQMWESGVKAHVRTKIVALKVAFMCNYIKLENCARSEAVATSPCCVRTARYCSAVKGGFLSRARTLRMTSQNRPGARLR